MRKLVAGALGCLVLVGCGGDGGKNNHFSVRQHLIEQNCPDNMTCDFLQVPKDYSQPNGEMIDIFYGVHKVQDPSNRIGALILNFGGPNAEAVQGAGWMAKNFLPQEILDRFDIVGIDPRGTGLSAFTDELTKCGGVEEHEMKAVCDKTYPNIVPFLGSNAVVRDIDRLREVLGDSQLTFLGYSYGSRLGALYAHTFPDKVRAIVLDSPLSPVAANNVEIRVGNTAGYDKTLSHRLSFDASPERRDRLQTIIHLAEDRGYYYAADIDLGRAYLSDAMYAAVARESWGEWDYIQDAMTILLDHDSAEGILSGLDQIWQNQDNSITPEDFRALAHFRAVVCTDERLPLAENELQSALFRYEAGSSLYGKFVYEKTASLCSGWTAARDPIADMSDLEARLNGKQILVIGGRLDPATPYAWTEEMVSSLGASASLLTMENYVEHGFSYNGFDCIDQATTAYLLDPSQKVSDRVCQPYSWYSFGFDRVFPVPHPTRNIIGW